MLFNTYQQISVIQVHQSVHKCEHIDPMPSTALPKIALLAVAVNETFFPNQQRLLVCQRPNSHDLDEGRWAVLQLFERKKIDLITNFN